ncbi:OPT superfamily oligopeptide transporter [Meredithblackwellia eburnea MCA 4105]
MLDQRRSSSSTRPLLGQSQSRSTGTTAQEPPSDDSSHPEFTFRAVSVGLLIGTLLCFCNTYFGLQTGWISMMSYASLLGYAVFKVLPQSSIFAKRPLTVRENIVLQTTAVATGTLPLGAGLVGVIPALAQLNPKTDGSGPIILSLPALVAWCLAVAFFGVFLAVPLRKSVIVKEKLVFPSGTATAQVIGVLHSAPLRADSKSSYAQLPTTAADGEDEVPSPTAGTGEVKENIDRKGWEALSWSFVISAGYTLLSLAFPVIYAIPIFNVFGNLAHDWLWWFTPSFSYVGQGIIMGLPTTASMNLGMICGWALLSPLSKKLGWAPGPVSSTADGARGWILWVALAIFLAESVFSMTMITLSTFFAARNRRAPGVGEDEEGEGEGLPPSAREEVDARWVWVGFALCAVMCCVIVSAVFGEEGIKWWATVIALGLASVFSVLGVRALGETDLNPVSAIGKLSQLLFAIVQPHNVVANLIAGGISEAGAQQAGDLMQDLKTGYLHNASPKAQFYGQMIGSLASVFVSSGIYALYRRVYELPSTNFPVPTATIWLNLARLVNDGQLPPKSKEAMLLFGIVFAANAAVKTAAGASGRDSWVFRVARYAPSGTAFAIGFLNTPSFSLARLLGGLISYWVTQQSRAARPGRSSPSSSNHLENITLIIVASGFVLGEGFASVVGLVAKSFGAGPVSCFGCGLGGGGYCPSC